MYDHLVVVHLDGDAEVGLVVDLLLNDIVVSVVGNVTGLLHLEDVRLSTTVLGIALQGHDARFLLPTRSLLVGIRTQYGILIQSTTY